MQRWAGEDWTCLKGRTYGAQGHKCNRSQSSFIWEDKHPSMPHPFPQPLPAGSDPSWEADLHTVPLTGAAAPLWAPTKMSKRTWLLPSSLEGFRALRRRSGSLKTDLKKSGSTEWVLTGLFLDPPPTRCVREVGTVQGALWGITKGSKRWAVNPDKLQYGVSAFSLHSVSLQMNRRLSDFSDRKWGKSLSEVFCLAKT